MKFEIELPRFSGFLESSDGVNEKIKHLFLCVPACIFDCEA